MKTGVAIQLIAPHSHRYINTEVTVGTETFW